MKSHKLVLWRMMVSDVSSSLPLYSLETNSQGVHRAAALQIQTMEWPACSPDLNPIEHIWDQLGRAMRRRINHHNTSTLLDRRCYLQEECNALPQEQIRRLINSMRQRCQACDNA